MSGCGFLAERDKDDILYLSAIVLASLFCSGVLLCVCLNTQLEITLDVFPEATVSLTVCRSRPQALLHVT